ncbi:FAD-binding protein [Amycolatopsis jiangsuensis]|uniref:Xylitol oxidase n=1 Tax=Amycolatopsis jiangsuensis TaxID=1181879 RepID=A0A840IRN7_9PSEU|nr:FAD-binding protein [Amycolatopsis jiangsuensis]MBB4684199.1 xylitol oxidase [Amycolatopsis jiangsuensis]
MSETARATRTNWAGNLVYQAREIRAPRTVEEAQELVAHAPRVKALGSRHSFNKVADSPDGLQLELSGLDVPTTIDPAAATVTLGGGVRYSDVVEQIHQAGFALANLASLPHITVAGSVVTGTHGSGQHQPGLASAVSAVELLTADGELHTFTRAGDPDVFPGVVVNAGALGVLTRLTLDLEPAFDVRQDAFDTLHWTTAVERFDEIQAAGYSVSMFTDWARDAVDQVLLKNRVPADVPGTLFGAVPADGPRHPAHAAGVSSENTTVQGGVPGPWYDRLPHFRVGFAPSVGAELQSEYFVPRAHAAAAFDALRGIGDRIAELVLVSEIRTLAADDLWLSPGYGGDRVALHFTWQHRQPEVEALLPLLEERLRPFGVRAHWGKLLHGSPLEEGHSGLPKFRALAQRLDPDGKFRNPFLDRLVFGEPA